MRIVVPAEFIRSTLNREGEAARGWLDALPGALAELARRWGLSPDGGLLHGYVGVVQPVRRGSELAVLKISWPDPDARLEAQAMSLWGGHGAAKLLEHAPEHHALLLERLDAQRPLRTLEPDAGLEIAGRLLRRLAVPAPDHFPTTQDQAQKLADELPGRWHKLDHPFRLRDLDMVQEHTSELIRGGERLIVNHDLHHDNVLAALGSEREDWRAIDPKVFAGDPAYGVPQLLWQDAAGIQSQHDLIHRLRLVAQAAEVDPQRAAAWCRLRTLDYGLWALGVGLTRDPVRCARLLEWLA